MRVLVVHNRYRSALPSGETDVVDREVKLLRSAGVDVFRHERDSDDIARSGLRERARLPIEVVWSRPALREMKVVLARLQPDLVHLHNTFPLLSPSVLAACGTAGVPAVATLHNFRFACANSHLMRDNRPCVDCLGRLPVPALVHRCYRGSLLATAPVAAGIAVQHWARTWQRHVSTFLVPSGFMVDILSAQGLPRERVIVKPNFVADTPVRATGDEHVFTTLGRLSPEKGLDLLRSGWEAARLPRAELRIVGSGPLEPEIRKWSAAAPGVTLVGRLSPEECAVDIARSRAVVVTSVWYETFGLVAIEAFRAGVPVIAPAHGPFPDLITPGVNGFLFEPGSAESLAACLRKVALTPDLPRLRKQARATYENNFTPERNLQRLLDVYQRAVGPASRRVRVGVAPT